MMEMLVRIVLVRIVRVRIVAGGWAASRAKPI